jgi:hypothetical protein
MAYGRIKSRGISRMSNTENLARDTQGHHIMTKNGGHFVHNNKAIWKITPGGGFAKTPGGNHIVRKARGTTVGGQFAVDPNGPMAKSAQAKLLGKHPEDLAKEDFKRRKKEAMVRFLAKQKEEKKQANAIGMPGPVTRKKYEKLQNAGQPIPAQLRKKLRGYSRIAHNLGHEGFRTQLNAGVVKPIGTFKHKVGDLTPNGQNVWDGNAWQVVPPKKGAHTLAVERHERHVAERKRKEKEVFMEGKRIAARRHNAKVKGKDFNTPADPNFGEQDKSGKFKWQSKRNVRGRRMMDKQGNVKGEWRLIPTNQRGWQVVHLGQRGALGAQPPPSGIPGLWQKIAAHHAAQQPANKTSDTHDCKKPDGSSIKLIGIRDRNVENGGIFDKQHVTIEGDGEGIFKSNGYGGGTIYNLEEGFAYREVETYHLDQMLGLNVVPVTEEVHDNTNPLRKSAGDYHSLQHFINGAKNGARWDDDKAYNSLVDKSEVAKTVLLDTILGNTDRHGNNWMVGNGHFYAIDNGLEMADDEEDPLEVMNGWRCSLKYQARKGPDGAPNPGHHGTRPTYILSSVYKTKLEGIIKDGSLQKLIDHVASGSKAKPQKRVQEYANAAMVRAKRIVAEWDTMFHD